MVQLAQALAQSSIHSVCTRPGALGAGKPWRLRPLRLLADECQGRPRMPRTNATNECGWWIGWERGNFGVHGFWCEIGSFHELEMIAA